MPERLRVGSIRSLCRIGSVLDVGIRSPDQECRIDQRELYIVECAQLFYGSTANLSVGKEHRNLDQARRVVDPECEIVFLRLSGRQHEGQ